MGRRRCTDRQSLRIGSDVIAKQDAYIGEGVKIPGRLVVSGTLDIGEKVEIAQGFEAYR